ncbi:MAG: DMT family transporter [Pseudomonadota bacterium]
MTHTSQPSTPRSDYAAGTLLVIISAITFSTAGLFTKGVEAGAWEVIFWRGLSAAAFTCFWIALRGAARREFGTLGPSGCAVGVIGALGTAAFIPSFKLTSIANVSLIYAISPLIAAMLAWIFIGERAQARTIAGCLGALLGVAIIVSGSLGELSLYGDLLALWMTFAMASIMVIYRKYPQTPGAGPQVLQSLLLLPCAGLIGAPLAVAPAEIGILIAFGLLFAIASVTLAEGAKRIASGQTALLSSLETPLAPLLAFFVLAEIPDGATWAGGALVLVAVLVSINTRPA